MSNKKPVAPAAPDAAAGVAVEPPGGWPADEYTGIGGRYVRDPVTGKRHPAPPEADDAAIPAAPVAAPVTDKE